MLHITILQASVQDHFLREASPWQNLSLKLHPLKMRGSVCLRLDACLENIGLVESVNIHICTCVGSLLKESL